MRQDGQFALEEELLGLLANQVRYSPAPVILSMGLIAYMASGYVSPWVWGSWIAAVVAMQLVRSLLFLHLAAQKDVDARSRLRRAIGMNLGNTFLHSLSLIWFPMFTLFEAAAQSMLFIGMGVASIATTVGYRPFSLVHVVVGLLPLFGLWIWRGVAGEGGAVALALGGIGIGYALTLTTVANRIFRMYRETFDNRQQLQLALAQAEAADRAKTRFLAAASHDLRQPIHALTLFATTLGMRQLDERSHQIVEKIEAAVNALSHEMDALLDISRLDAGIVKVRRRGMSLHTFLDRLREELMNAAAKRGVAVRLDCPENAMAHTDPALLERIVRNLMVNAINHNTDCALLLCVAAHGEQWKLTVSDTGCGIPDAEQERIFEEFYQVANPERDRNKGLGLGLAIVQRLAGLLQLDMMFSSQAGRGTTFQFILPGISELPASPASESTPGFLRSLLILVVDDEPDVREGMRCLLETLGCEVVATDGTDTAVCAARKRQPDLVLADFRLRNHDSGLTTIERLRDIYPGLPAIIISGDTAPERLREARDAGVPILSKPVLVEPLKEAIAASCRLEG